jgi:hypothetical protein
VASLIPTDQAGIKTLCSTVRSGNSRRSWGMWPMPLRARACVGVLASAVSENSTEPALGASKPMTLHINVVLPAPSRPIRPTTASDSTLTPPAAVTALKLLYGLLRLDNDAHATLRITCVNSDQSPPGGSITTISMVMPSAICQVSGECS